MPFIISDLETFILRYWPFLLVAAIWSIAWKGVALWRAAQRRNLPWFVALLVINTVGLLEIFYLFVVLPSSEKQDAQG